MTKQFRDSLIAFIALFIFIVGIFITNHLLWLLLIVFVPALLINWLLNKYNPLKKGPEITWWKEVLITFLIFLTVFVIIKIRFDDPIFSFDNLILLIVFLIANTLGTLRHRSNTQ